MLNMSFEKRVIINTNETDWVQSPKAGVLRKPLAREEAESGHATSIVRYDPGAAFSSHGHPFGEEIYVIDGTFSDHSGDYHAGTYFRNPEGFKHSPFSKEGCTIFVKLRQFQVGDNAHLCIDTLNGQWEKQDNGVASQMLHKFNGETVELQKWPANTKTLTEKNNPVEELLIISGEISDSEGSYPSGTWIRSPSAQEYNTHSSQGALVLKKTGHFSI